MTYLKPKSVAIIGLGRFGRLWASILKDDFVVKVYDEGPSAAKDAAQLKLELVTLPAALSAEVIFYCVPISTFEKVLISHLPFFIEMSGKKILIDVLSVKMHPKEIFSKYLPTRYSAILTHPMFGPDSVKLNGLINQSLVMDRFKSTEEEFNFWQHYLESKGINIIKMDADEHDRLAANSQGVTHFIGRILGEFDFESTPIDTVAAKKLFEIKTQICHDTWQLFVDLQTYNPYTRAMRVKLSAAQSKIFNQLLPNRIYKDRLVVGIQGGKGSFNEEAARYYLNRTADLPFELKYLYTTENVLRALHEGIVDRGQFAIHNSAGGMVNESVEAMAQYNFDIIEEFAIKISHALMIASDTHFSVVDTIMAHPQALRQCRMNLEKKYHALKQMSGQGELVDPAKVAELLGKGELGKNIAVLGSKVLAAINHLRVIEDNLQDLDVNLTSFLWVQRRSV